MWPKSSFANIWAYNRVMFDVQGLIIIFGRWIVRCYNQSYSDKTWAHLPRLHQRTPKKGGAELSYIVEKFCETNCVISKIACWSIEIFQRYVGFKHKALQKSSWTVQGSRCDHTLTIVFFLPFCPASFRPSPASARSCNSFSESIESLSPCGEAGCVFCKYSEGHRLILILIVSIQQASAY